MHCVYFFYFETKGITLEELDFMFEAQSPRKAFVNLNFYPVQGLHLLLKLKISKWKEVLHPNSDIEHLGISKSVQSFTQLKSLPAYNINYHLFNEAAYYTLNCNKYFLHCHPGHVK